MDRRAFIGRLALGILAMPHTAPAQPARKVARIGILGVSGMTSDMVGPQPRGEQTNSLLRGLRELGYVYGRDFVTEIRSAENRPERYPGLAAELVGLQVDVIVAGGPVLFALKALGLTIPPALLLRADQVIQ